MNNLELLNHLKTKAITQKTTNLGVFETKEFVPMSVIDEAIANLKPAPTDKQIQDILVAYKRRDAFATGATGTTLKRAIEMIRELYEDGAK